jgi:hypothetical protein
MMNHKSALRDTRLLVSQGLPPRRHRRLREHLRGCDDCMRHYERLRAVEDALTPAAVMSETALERLGALVLDDVAPAPAPRHGYLGWAFGFGTAAALALALVVAVPPTPNDELTPRGATVASKDHGIAAFLVDPLRGEAARAAVVANRRVDVPAGKVVQLAYRNAKYRYGVVVGVDAAYDLQWYHPGASERASGGVALVAGAVDEPLPGAWSIDSDMTPLRLFAIFSETPIDAAAIEGAVQRLRSSGQGPRDAERLPGLPYAQDSLLFETQEAAKH